MHADVRVEGEGMPVKKSETKGDLFLTVHVEFPEDGFFIEKNQTESIRNLLPGTIPPIEATEVDEVQYEEKEDLEEFGAGSDDPRAPGAHWEDEDEEMDGQPQCAQQ